ncbi:MAG: outer membrane lipoprotein carrier protein LolA [Gammaproteobacteria bacterium]|nr:outer membrane lipoprotein carrier protein LolA [Gammaproteobacteria bacterium]
MTSGKKNISKRHAAVMLAATLIVLAAPGKAVYAGLTVDQLMQKLAAVKSSEARFAETRHSQFLEKPMKLSGKLIYEAPDTLIKQTTRPLNETFTIKGQRLVVERMQEGKKLQHEVGLHDFPALAPVVLGLRSVLAGDLKTLEKYYDVTIQGSEQDWTLRLKPRRHGFEEDDWLKDVVKLVTMRGQGVLLSQVEIIEPSGDKSVTLITHPDRR